MGHTGSLRWEIFINRYPTPEVLKTIDVFRGQTQTYRRPNNGITLLDSNGTFWYGTWGLGLYRINLAIGQVRNYGYESYSPREPIAQSIAGGPGNSIWTAAYRDGVMQFDPASGSFLKLPFAEYAFPFT